MSRKMARIEIIEELTSIEGADKIELARIGGWRVIVMKGLYGIGDKVVYFEVDSLLPDNELFEGAAGRDGLKDSMDFDTMEISKGYRLKCIRLRGVYSQGLAIPVDVVAQTYPEVASKNVGEDLTDLIGIKVYERPVRASNGSAPPRGNFPSYIRKTDQERCLSDDTIVSTPAGDVRIDTVVVGDYVLSYNHANDVNEYKKVTAVSKASKIDDGWFMLKMKSGAVLEVTHNHKIWCEDVGEYVLVSDLVVGNKVKLIE